MEEIKIRLTLREKMTTEELEKVFWKIIENSEGKICIVDKIKEKTS